jgi:hypothetical protein
MNVRTARMLLITVAALAVMALGTAAADANVGILGPTYTGATAPSGEKPQSKLWFNDGTWWADMFNKSTRNFEIYKYSSGVWVSTGTMVEDRPKGWQDMKWDGTYLHVVSHGPASTTGADVATDGIRYSRFSYDQLAKQYVPVANMTGVHIAEYGVKAAVMDEDSTGRLWITFTHGLDAMLTYSSTGTTWATPFPIPGKKNLAKLPQDEISSVVSFDRGIGVMWSNEKTGAYYFARHDDTQIPSRGWTYSTAMQGAEMADDHMNMKAIDADPAGRVFAIVKTSLDRTIDPLLVLVIRDGKGRWHQYTAWNHGTAQPTRGQVVVDLANRQIYVFAAAPCCAGGIVYMKKTSLDHPSFDAASLGTPVLGGDGEKINNATTPKDPVDASTDLMVMASADNTRHYWFNKIPLGGPDLTAPETTITDAPSGQTGATGAEISFTASEPASGYTCTLDGAPFTPCSSPATVSGLAAGDHTFTVAATDAAGNTDPTPDSRTWTVSTAAPIFADDFSSGGFGNWSSVQTGPDGSTQVLNGAAQLAATTTAGSFAYARKVLAPAIGSLTAAATVRVDAQGGSGANVPLLRLFDPSGARLVSLYRQNSATSNVVYVAHSGTIAQTAARLPIGTARRFEVQVAAPSTLIVRMDGTEVYRTDAAAFGAGIGAVQIGNDTKAQAFSVNVDDVDVR